MTVAAARGLARSPSDRDVNPSRPSIPRDTPAPAQIPENNHLVPRIVGGLSTASIFPDMILGILLQHRLLDGRESDYLRCKTQCKGESARAREREVPKDGRPVGRACTDMSKNPSSF